MKDLDASRVKSNYRSALTYSKRAATVRRGKRQVQPSRTKETRGDLSDKAVSGHQNKKVVSKIMKGLKI